MRTKVYLLALFCLGWIGCTNEPNSSGTEQTPADTVSQPTETGRSDTTGSAESGDFKATGTEPFWRIDITKTMMKFTSLVEGYENFATPYSEPTTDEGGTHYEAETEAGTLRVDILEGECINAMSGARSDYTVTVAIKRGIDPDFKVFEGCGEYITD